jgi:hypothetical protein
MVDLVRPYLSAVQDAQDSNPVGGHDIGGDEGRTRNDKLARPSDSTGASALWKVEKPPHGGDNLIVDIDQPRAGFRPQCV